MARQVKVNNEAREKYVYFAYPRKLERTLQAMIVAEAGKYGIENVKDLIKNVLMETIIHWEKTHRFIESAEWASANWQKNRFSDTTATNVDEKLGNQSKAISEMEKRLYAELEEIKKLKEKTLKLTA